MSLSIKKTIFYSFVKNKSGFIVHLINKLGYKKPKFGSFLWRWSNVQNTFWDLVIFKKQIFLKPNGRPWMIVLRMKLNLVLTNKTKRCLSPRQHEQEIAVWISFWTSGFSMQIISKGNIHIWRQIIFGCFWYT